MLSMSQQKTLAFFVGLAALLALGAVAFVALVMLRGPAIDESVDRQSWKLDETSDRLFWKAKDDLMIVTAPRTWTVRELTVDDVSTIIIEDPAEGDPRRGVGIEIFSLHSIEPFENWKSAYWQDRAIDESIMEDCGVVNKWGTNLYCYQPKDGTVVPGGQIYITQTSPGIMMVVHYDDADTEVDLNLAPGEFELGNALLIQ